MTLAEARTQVAAHLDDANNVRWSTTRIDAALESAIGRSVTEYVAAGGDVFTEEVNASSTTAGLLDLSSYNPLRVCGVAIKSGDIFYPIMGIDRAHKERVDNVARDCYVQLVRTPSISATTSHPLVQYASDGTGMGSFEEFDHWVCLRAALLLAAQDAEDRPELRRLEGEHAKSAMARPRVPSARLFPRRRGWLSQFLVYNYEPRSEALQICQAVW